MSVEKDRSRPGNGRPRMSLTGDSQSLSAGTVDSVVREAASLRGELLDVLPGVNLALLAPDELASLAGSFDAASRAVESAHDAAFLRRGLAVSESAVPRVRALADLDAEAEHLRGYFVVQVVVDDAGHRRTTLYRSAGAAQRAVERARERGRTAHVTMCQLLPVGVVWGGL